MKIIVPTEEEDKRIREGIEQDPDAQEWTSEMFVKATRGSQVAPVKQKLTVRFDPDIVKWFKSKGAGYQTRMNNALREYINQKS